MTSGEHHEPVIVDHDGDVSLLPGMPSRPAWSDPDHDDFVSDIGWCSYRTSPMTLIYQLRPRVTPSVTVRSTTSVAAILCHNGRKAVVVGVHPADAPSATLVASPSEARRLARELERYADIAESEACDPAPDTPMGGPPMS